MHIPENLKFDDKGLIPAIIQDWKTNEVLMMAYMNEASLKKTVQSGLTWFWSRSRQKFWQKGETSGHIQRVKDILYDCDQDTLLIKIEQTGPACHTGEQSCFFRSFADIAQGKIK
jgi:phosphoribosyl-ATP pyrophosphohydrolase/phosphoribosyl-AMP cyclohydrolase